MQACRHCGECVGIFCCMAYAVCTLHVHRFTVYTDAAIKTDDWTMFDACTCLLHCEGYCIACIVKDISALLAFDLYLNCNLWLDQIKTKAFHACLHTFLLEVYRNWYSATARIINSSSTLSYFITCLVFLWLLTIFIILVKWHGVMNYLSEI